MARCNAVAFEALCPELIDRILERVVAERGSTWKALATVNKAFLDSFRRCSKSLVIESQKGKMEAPEPGSLQSNLQIAVLFERQERAQSKAFVKELKLRPRLSRLIMRETRPLADILSALSQVHWSSVTTHPCDAWHVLKFLSGSKSSLKKLDLKLGDCFFRDLYDDIQRIMRAFPALESLKLNVSEKRHDYSVEGPWRLGASPNNLRDLAIAGVTFSPWWEPFRALPACLTGLSRLSFKCDDTSPILPPKLKSLAIGLDFTCLQTLSLEIRTLQSTLAVLESVTEHCPCLRDLQVCAIPKRFERITAPEYEKQLQISALVKKCPALERLVISWGQVLASGDFLELLLSGGFETDAPYLVDRDVFRAMIVLLRESSIEAELLEQSTSLKSVSLFRFLFPTCSPWSSLRLDNPRFKKWLLGERRNENLWCKIFCWSNI